MGIPSDGHNFEGKSKTNVVQNLPLVSKSSIQSRKKESKKLDVNENRIITWDELEKHNTAKDCWIAVRGKVYDVTSWVSRHPGGEDTLVLNGGRDATQIFESYHPIRVFPLINKYYIGEINSDFKHPSFPPMSEFYITLKKKVEEYFINKKMSPRYAPDLIIRTMFYISLSLYLHYVCLFSTSLIVTLIGGIIMGISCGFTTFIAVHEGSHASTTNSPWFWRIFGAIGGDFVNGASFYAWLHQHFLGHHPFTNLTNHSTIPGEDSLDPDTITHDPDLRRIKPDQPYRDHYKYQKFYMPLLYGFLVTKFRINDCFIVFVDKKNGSVKLNPPNTWHLTAFILGKSFWLFYRIILPCFYVSIWKVLFHFLITDLAMGYTLALVFQVNHVMPQATWPKVDKETGYVNMDWAEMQVRTTVDYGHGSYWTTFFSGGLNYQVTHHLFPYVAQSHYIEIGKIVTQHCKDYKIDYVVLPSYWVALKMHIEYLSKMGIGAIHSDF